jgi:hypothetical protein
MRCGVWGGGCVAGRVCVCVCLCGWGSVLHAGGCASRHTPHPTSRRQHHPGLRCATARATRPRGHAGRDGADGDAAVHQQRAAQDAGALHHPLRPPHRGHHQPAARQVCGGAARRRAREMCGGGQQLQRARSRGRGLAAACSLGRLHTWLRRRDTCCAAARLLLPARAAGTTRLAPTPTSRTPRTSTPRCTTS